MRRSYLINAIAVTAILLFTATMAAAQLEPMRGSVKLVGADGQSAPVAGAQIDIYRTDMKAEYHTKSDKKGEWAFAGLPFVGTYTVTVSAAGAAPSTKTGVKARGDQPLDIVLQPGDGKKLTQAEALAAKSDPATANNGNSGASAEEKAKAEELRKKNEEITKENDKIKNANQIIGDAFKNGNAALMAKNYDEAIKLYDTGIAADPEHPGVPSLLTNKAEALRLRGADKFNTAARSTDQTAKTAGIAAAKEDFTAAAEAASKAVEMMKKRPAATDPGQLKQDEVNKYYALSARAKTVGLVAMKVDQTKGAEAAAAYEEYIAAEPDATKKAAIGKEYAEVLFETAADQAGYEKAIAQFQKVLEKTHDDPDALLRIGQALFNIGALNNNDKAKYQEASNYLQRYVDKGPDGQLKTEAKELIATMKQQANVTPEKDNRPPQRKRP